MGFDSTNFSEETQGNLKTRCDVSTRDTWYIGFCKWQEIKSHRNQRGGQQLWPGNQHAHFQDICVTR